MKHVIVLFTILVACFMLIAGCGSKKDPGHSADHADSLQASADHYTCPMHPSVRSDKPGVCPICHMTLVKVSEVQNSAGDGEQASNVAVSPSKQVLANVSTIQVESKSLVQEIHLAGKIDYAEPNTQKITTRYGGRIEKLAVSYVGQQVQRGDPVAELYSPEAITAQQEFLSALESSAKHSEASGRIDPNGAGLLEQSKTKLRYWGFTDEQIAELSALKTVKPLVTVHSPVSGTVISKNVELQKYVSPGDALFDISDLRTVWLQVDVYESDIAAVKIGQAITATVEAFPSEEFRGTVSFIASVVDPSTRTVRIRATLNNANRRLKPEMFAQAILHVPLPNSIVVPATAVIANGKQTVVWIEGEANHFQARAVTLGHRAGDFYQVLEGLTAGDKIAVSGAYLIDSESQLQVAATGAHGH